MLRDEVRWEKDKVVVLYGVIGAFWGGGTITKIWSDTYRRLKQTSFWI